MGRIDEHMTGDRKRQRAEVQRRQRRHRKTTADYHARQAEVGDRTDINARNCAAKTTRKNVFGKRTMAEIAARKMSEDVGTEIVVYRCRVCRRWHLATKKKRGE